MTTIHWFRRDLRLADNPALNSAWEEAQSAMGDVQAAVVVAAILQRGTAIVSAGGYIRDLTRKAENGEFSIGPMLMALIGTRKREKKRA